MPHFPQINKKIHINMTLHGHCSLLNNPTRHLQRSEKTLPEWSDNTLLVIWQHISNCLTTLFQWSDNTFQIVWQHTPMTWWHFSNGLITHFQWSDNTLPMIWQHTTNDLTRHFQWSHDTLQVIYSVMQMNSGNIFVYMKMMSCSWFWVHAADKPREREVYPTHWAARVQSWCDCLGQSCPWATLIRAARALGKTQDRTFTSDGWRQYFEYCILPYSALSTAKYL